MHSCNVCAALSLSPSLSNAVACWLQDITWGAGGTTSEQTMDIAIAMRKEFGIVSCQYAKGGLSGFGR